MLLHPGVVFAPCSHPHGAEHPMMEFCRNVRSFCCSLRTNRLLPNNNTHQEPRQESPKDCGASGKESAPSKDIPPPETKKQPSIQKGVFCPRGLNFQPPRVSRYSCQGLGVYGLGLKGLGWFRLWGCGISGTQSNQSTGSLQVRKIRKTGLPRVDQRNLVSRLALDPILNPKP